MLLRNFTYTIYLTHRICCDLLYTPISTIVVMLFIKFLFLDIWKGGKRGRDRDDDDMGQSGNGHDRGNLCLFSFQVVKYWLSHVAVIILIWCKIWWLDSFGRDRDSMSRKRRSDPLSEGLSTARPTPKRSIEVIEQPVDVATIVDDATVRKNKLNNWTLSFLFLYYFFVSMYWSYRLCIYLYTLNIMFDLSTADSIILFC